MGNSAWIDAVILSQIVVLYGLAGSAGARLLWQAAAAKNPQWAADNRRFFERRWRWSWPPLLSWAMGAGWLAWIWNGGGTDWPPGRLLLPALGWVLLETALAALFYRRLWQTIPLPARRGATLAPRRLADHLHAGWLAPPLAALVLLVLAYLGALLDGRGAPDFTAWRIGAIVAGGALWALTLQYCVRRRKQAADTVLGPRYQHWEVIGTVACLYLFALAVGLRASRELWRQEVVTELHFFAAASILLQLTVLFCLLCQPRLLTTVHPSKEVK